MRTVLVVFSLLGLGGSAAAQRIDERAPFDGGVVRISIMEGTVRVLGWAHDSIAVTGTGDSLEVYVGEGGAKVGVWNPKKQQRADIEVRVPARADVWVKTGSADIGVGGITGGLELISVTGGIQVTGRPGTLSAETMGGSIAASVDAQRVTLRTAMGGIALRGAVDQADVTTVTGTIDIDGGSIQMGRFESIEGRLMHRGPFMARAKLTFTTHSAPIEFVIPEGAAAFFTFRTFEGKFDDRLGLAFHKSGTRESGRELVFGVGEEGTAEIEVQSFRGALILRR